MAESTNVNDAVEMQYFTSDDGSVKVPSVFMAHRADVAAEMEIKKAIEEYKWKDGDFLLATYPKNGTHFMWEVMMMLLRGSADYIKDSKVLCMMDIFPLSKSDALFPSPRVLNTHYRLDVLPKEFRGRKTVFEYVKDFLTAKKLSYGNYFDYTEYMWSLRDDPNMLVVFFEDLKTDTVATVQKVNEFMGTGRSPELVEAIANAVEFSKMKKGKAESMVNAGKMIALTKNVEKKDETMRNMAKKLYRKGEIGDWKNHLTVADNEMFDKVLEQWSVSEEIPYHY